MLFLIYCEIIICWLLSFWMSCYCCNCCALCAMLKKQKTKKTQQLGYTEPDLVLEW